MSTLDVSESMRIEGELAALRDAIAGGKFPQYMLNVMRPYAEVLSRRLEELAGVDFSGPKSEEEKKARETVALEATVAKIEADHARFMKDGFHSKEDFFTFGKNLENDSYWAYLQEHDDERKKIAEKLAEPFFEKAKREGIPLEEQAEYVRKEGRKTLEESGLSGKALERATKVLDEGIESRLNKVGLNQDTAKENSQVKQFTADVENMAGKEKVEVLAQKNAVVEQYIAQNGAADKDKEMQTFNDRDGSRREVRNAVIAKADELKIDNKYEKDEGDDMAALIDTKEFQTAKNTLQKAQKQTQDKPASSATEVQIAQNNANKAEGMSV